MHGLISFIPGLLFAPDSQQNILGLPWWVWLLVLIVIIVLLWLLFSQPKPEPKPDAEEEVAIEPPAGPVVPTIKPVSPFTDVPGSLDDLTLIEGIGPKISIALREAGLDSFVILAKTPPETITQVLKTAGFQLFDPTTWPEQASLIAAARWDDLKALQKTLQGGQRK